MALITDPAQIGQKIETMSTAKLYERDNWEMQCLHARLMVEMIARLDIMVGTGYKPPNLITKQARGTK